MSLFSFKVSSIIYDCNDFFYFILFISDIFFFWKGFSWENAVWDPDSQAYRSMGKWDI
jgi:hypothetical protein